MKDRNTILIVDDKPENLFALKDLLGSLDVDVVQAGDGAGALMATLSHAFGLAIIDVQMPGMDGYELARLLRGSKETRAIPIIFLSAVYSDDWHIFQGYESGAVDFITKPFVPEILLSKVRIFLELERGRKTLLKHKRVLEKLVDRQRRINKNLRHEIAARSATERELKVAREQAETRAAEAEAGKRELQAMMGRLQAAEVEREKLLAKVQRQAEVLEATVRERTRELELKNRELQDFSAIASHDLQEPLRKVRAFGQRLRQEYADALGDEGRDLLQRMEKAADRMRGLIRDLLEYSRIATRTVPFMPVDLTRIAREALADLDQRLEETGGRIDLGDLPTAEVDERQMRQVFQNLLANALKYHGQEPPVVRVDGETVSEDGRPMARIFIRDNGIGFDMEHLDTIFQPFQRLHGRSKYEGTGIGLAIVRKIVERHGGTITATSERGKGATFIMTLPQQHEPQAAAQGGQAE